MLFLPELFTGMGFARGGVMTKTCLTGPDEPKSPSRFERALPRELVHRRSIAEVFITDVRREDDGQFIVCAQWPRWHVLYDGRYGHDSALLAETLRQLTIAIAHLGYGVPLGNMFLLPDMMVERMEAVTGIGANKNLEPGEVEITVRVFDVLRGLKGASRLRVEASYFAHGVLIARGSAGARIAAPGPYARLRRISGPSEPRPAIRAIDAAAVGHCSEWNVVLGASSARHVWPLRVDTTNPIYFDHPLDHVPGVLLLEAVRQVIRVALNRPHLDLDRFEAVFTEIVELHDAAEVAIVSLDVCPAGTVDSRVEVRAHGNVMMAARATSSLEAT